MQFVGGATFSSDVSGGTWDARRGTWDAARGTWDLGRRKGDQVQSFERRVPPQRAQQLSRSLAQASLTGAQPSCTTSMSQVQAKPFATGHLASMHQSQRKPLSEPHKTGVRSSFPSLTRGGSDPSKWDLYAQRSQEKLLARQGKMSMNSISTYSRSSQNRLGNEEG